MLKTVAMVLEEGALTAPPSSQWGLTLSGTEKVKNQSGAKWSKISGKLKKRPCRIGIATGPA